jgi:hypothetical protein
MALNRSEGHCIEYSLRDDQVLQFMLKDWVTIDSNIKRNTVVSERESQNLDADCNYPEHISERECS